MAVPVSRLPGSTFDFDFERGFYRGGTVHFGDTGSRYHDAILKDESNFQAELFPDVNGLHRNLAAGVTRLTDGMGMWAFRQRTQPVLWNRDLTNAAWTKTNCTAAKNQVGIDGVANACTRVTLTASPGTVSQSITLASQTFKPLLFARYAVGTPQVEVSIDGGTSYTDVSASVGAAGTAMGQCRITSIASQALANPQVILRITGSVSDAVDFDAVEAQYGAAGQLATTPTSPLITTTTAFVRFNEEPTWGSTGTKQSVGDIVMGDMLKRGVPIWGYVAVSGDNTSPTQVIFASDAAPNFDITGGVNGGTVQLTVGGIGFSTANTTTTGMANVNRVAFTAFPGGARLAVNGGVEATSTTAKQLVATATHVGVGNNGGGLSIDGVVRRWAMGYGELPPGRLTEMTR